MLSIFRGVKFRVKKLTCEQAIIMWIQTILTIYPDTFHLKDEGGYSCKPFWHLLCGKVVIFTSWVCDPS